MYPEKYIQYFNIFLKVIKSPIWLAKWGEKTLHFRKQNNNN